MCRGILQKSLCRMLVSLAEARLWGRPGIWGKRHQNTRRSRVTAYANLEPPKGLGVGFGFGFGLRLGSGWSGPTCKVELTTHLLHKFLQDAPAHTGWFRLNAQNCVPD